MIFEVRLKMRSEAIDPLGQNGYLDYRRARVFVVYLKLLDDLFLSSFCDGHALLSLLMLIQKMVSWAEPSP